MKIAQLIDTKLHFHIPLEYLFDAEFYLEEFRRTQYSLDRNFLIYNFRYWLSPNIFEWLESYGGEWSLYFNDDSNESCFEIFTTSEQVICYLELVSDFQKYNKMHYLNIIFPVLKFKSENCAMLFKLTWL